MLTPRDPPTAPAREIAARQIGNLECNIDRLSIVAGLGVLQKTLTSLAGTKYVCPLP